ncbi:catalase family protein [Rhizosaccharibacter radicis]|uniref:Catalase family protein n=1 Tax=Rhizosaccharibacter radicis TaxID=2782605 RepID=A0ABT1VX51_9PROT|nr:catalase family protein [Acetobacteraceae bacterium KSS12]
MDMQQFVPFHDGIETRRPEEDEAIDGIIETMISESRKVTGREHRAVRASHAKSSGIVKGVFEVPEGLPAPFAQGICARPGRYDVLARFAQGPGEVLPDKVSTHRGCALKLFGVRGPKLPGHHDDTQDFVLATGPVFPDPDAMSFLKSIRNIERNVERSDGLKAAVSAVARVANDVVKSVKGSDVPVLDFFGHAPAHPLAESYHSQAALRWGNAVAKVAIFPVSPGLQALAGETLDVKSDPDVFRRAVGDWFRGNEARFEFRVQLCTDLDAMPVEDASVPWPEDRSPYVTVATLSFPPQDALSPARLMFVEERMSFRPAHALEAHRPLGSLMRARLKVYGAMAAFRQNDNGSVPQEPATLAAVPD